MRYKCYRTNHVEDHVVERTDLPDHLVKSVTGQVAFTETQPRVGQHERNCSMINNHYGE